MQRTFNRDDTTQVNMSKTDETDFLVLLNVHSCYPTPMETWKSFSIHILISFNINQALIQACKCALMHLPNALSGIRVGNDD